MSRIRGWLVVAAGLPLGLWVHARNDDSFGLLLAGLSAFALLVGAVTRIAERPARRWARELVRDMRNLYAEPSVSPMQLGGHPEIDEARYRVLTEALEELGFRRLGDWQAQIPSQLVSGPIYTRVLVSARGETIAELSSPSARSDELRIAFQSELVDGTFVITADRPMSLRLPPDHDVAAMGPETPLQALVRAHEARLEARPVDGVRTVGTGEEALASEVRLRESCRAWRRSIGWIREDEFLKLAGPAKAKQARRLWPYVRELGIAGPLRASHREPRSSGGSSAEI